MKKSSIIMSVFLFFLFSISNIAVKADTINLKLSKGIYRIEDLKLTENSTCNIQNDSQVTIFITRINGNQEIMEVHRLEANSIINNIGPLKNADTIAILGSGTVTLTS